LFYVPEKFKKLILGMLVNTLSKEEMMKLTKTFNAIDLDHEGFISLDELKKAFEKSNINLSMNEITTIIENIDNDKNGKLNYSEFMMASINIKKSISKNKLINLFQNIDTKKSGYINVDNLKEYLIRTGREVENIDEIIQLFNEVSKSNNCKISVDEFYNIIDK